MYRIGALPEDRQTDAPQRVDETLALGAQRAVGFHDAFDGGGHLVLRYRRPDHLTEGGKTIGRATQADLIPLLAMLIDAEDADVAHVVVAAGVHAAGHLDLDLAQ